MDLILLNLYDFLLLIVYHLLNNNENIFISGIAEQKDLFINWTFEKIS